MESRLTLGLVKTSLHKIEPAHRYRTCADEDVYVLSSQLVAHEFREGITAITDHGPKIVLQLQGFGGPFPFVTAECYTRSFFAKSPPARHR
jgi:hypothetical protein